MRLQGKVAIVTGAAQGIGRAYALRFGQEGAHVVVADVLRDKADDVIRELHQAGHDAMAVAVDVSDRDSVLEMVTSCVERFGRVDVLLNNAALVAEAEQKPFEELSREEWDRVLAVNLTGSFLCCQAVAPHLRRRRKGRIINISSAVTRTSGPWAYAHYVVSKAGIVGLTRALAQELGSDNVTVNAISPGAVKTDPSQPDVPTDEIAQLISAQVLQRRETPDDLVGVAVFLASDDSRFITGQVINVDGGLNYR